VEIEDVLSRVMKGAYNMPRRISRDAKNMVRSMLEKVIFLETGINCRILLREYQRLTS
jgi:hypothetical protein